MYKEKKMSLNEILKVLENIKKNSPHLADEIAINFAIEAIKEKYQTEPHRA